MKPVHPQYKVSQIGITTKGKGLLSAPIPDKAKELQTMWNTRPVEPVKKGLLS